MFQRRAFNEGSAQKREGTATPTNRKTKQGRLDLLTLGGQILIRREDSSLKDQMAGGDTANVRIASALVDYPSW